MNVDMEQTELRRLRTARIRLRERIACLREYGYETAIDDCRSFLDAVDREIQEIKRKIRKSP